ncbi:MAG: HlyD family efflux transporter periplasmic adaptor subunit [Thermoanaerobaculia bacterium]
MSAPRRTTSLVPLAAAARGAEALAAKRGAAADQPGLRADLVIRRQLQMGEVRWWVKNPETLKYYLFEDHEWRLITFFDGSRSRGEIVADYNTSHPWDPIDLPLVLGYEEMLRKIGAIGESAAERNLTLLANARTARQRAAEERAEGFNVFFLLFHVLDPERFLKRTVKYVRWVWSPPVVAVWAVAVVWTVGVFALHFQDLWAGTYELYAFLRKPLLDVVHFFFILSFLGFFHEFGHAYAVKIYGGDVHDIGIALLYFTPAFYCDTTDALLFENKWHRLWVNTAGIYVEGFVCAGATALWVASYPDTLLHELAYKTMLFTGISTIFFNINPLVKIDGYHALTALLEMPDLREEAFRYIGALFQKHILRLNVEVPPVSRRRRRIFWAYGLPALAYLGVIMTFISRVFHNLYNKLFADFAIAFLIVTLYYVFRKRVRLVIRTARLFYLDKKEVVMSDRARWPLAAAAGVLALILFVPWTRRTISVEAVLRPWQSARIEAPEDSRVSAVLTRESEAVREGARLFQLVSEASAADTASASAQHERLVKAANAARQEGAATTVFETEARDVAASASVRGQEVRRKQLLLASPIAGRVLTPWVEDLEQRFVTRGTVLAEIGDCTRMVADLPVSERLLDDLQVGAPVRALVGQRPLGPMTGRVASISPATLDQPRTAAEAADPPAPTLLPDRFVARAVFDNTDGQLRPGAHVRAKVYGRRASYAARAWRVLRRWVQTIVW